MSRINRAKPRGRRLLVVDDDQELLRSTARLLRRRGYEVETATDGPGALAALRERPPDGILLDWYLADTTAEALLPEVREIVPGARVLLVSGWAAEQAAAALVGALGVAGFHDKGDGAAALLERVDAMMGLETT